MAYEKQTWHTGDVITEGKLNHMEDGIANAGGVLVITATDNQSSTTLDKTWQEIWNWIVGGNGLPIVRHQVNGAVIGIDYVVAIEDDDPEYLVYTVHFDGSNVETPLFTCYAPDEYPSFGLL